MLILTGPPGTGKTTVAAQIARATPRGLHVPADVFWTFPAHPISPYRSEGHHQNTDIITAVVRTAIEFAASGYDVVLDGIFGPWFLPTIVRQFQPTPVALEYVVLMAPLDVALSRTRQREGDGRRDHVVRKMHEEFGDLGRYRSHVIDTADLDPESVVAALVDRRRTGIFAVDPA